MNKKFFEHLPDKFNDSSKGVMTSILAKITILKIDKFKHVLPIRSWYHKCEFDQFLLVYCYVDPHRNS